MERDLDLRVFLDDEHYNVVDGYHVDELNDPVYWLEVDRWLDGVARVKVYMQWDNTDLGPEDEYREIEFSYWGDSFAYYDTIDIPEDAVLSYEP